MSLREGEAGAKPSGTSAPSAAKDALGALEKLGGRVGDLAGDVLGGLGGAVKNGLGVLPGLGALLQRRS